jgi:hypothetical protein
MDTRHQIDVVWIDNREDEVVLVKKIDELLQLIQSNKERIVCIICNEDVSTIHIQKGDKK